MQILAFSSANSDPLVALVLFFVLFVLVFIYTFFQNQCANDNLSALAGRLGFVTDASLRIPGLRRGVTMSRFRLNFLSNTPPRERGIMGIKRGRKLRFAEFYTGFGRSRKTWVEIAVSAQVNEYRFSLRHQHIGNALLDLLGQPEINIGDPEFDRGWRIMTNGTATTQALLQPDLRRKIDKYGTKFTGAFIFENNWLRYQELGDFSGDSRTARLEGMVDFMCDFAEAIERTDKEAG